MKKWFLVFTVLAILVSICSVFAVADGQFIPSAGIYGTTGQPINMREYQTSVPDDGYFPWCLEITGVEARDDGFYTVTGATYPVTADSHVYGFISQDGDWMDGDLVAVIMGNNGTADVTDDMVLAARYIGAVLQ